MVVLRDRIDEGSDAARARGELPAEFGQRTRAGAGLTRLRARRRAIDDAARDALQDAAHAEQVVGHVELPVGHHRLDAGAAGALGVALHIAALARDAERGEVEPADAAERSRLDVP